MVGRSSMRRVSKQIGRQSKLVVKIYHLVPDICLGVEPPFNMAVETDECSRLNSRP